MTELEEQCQIARPLEKLERLIAVDATRGPEREAFVSRVSGSARGEVLCTLPERLWLTRDDVSFDHTGARRAPAQKSSLPGQNIDRHLPACTSSNLPGSFPCLLASGLWSAES